MAHLLPLRIVETAVRVLAVCRIMSDKGAVLSKVDFMVEEGRLGRCSRYYWDLDSISKVYTAAW
jgi:hypothetical protein